jgi:hypothetical protein
MCQRAQIFVEDDETDEAGLPEAVQSLTPQAPSPTDPVLDSVAVSR